MTKNTYKLGESFFWCGIDLLNSNNNDFQMDVRLILGFSSLLH